MLISISATCHCGAKVACTQGLDENVAGGTAHVTLTCKKCGNVMYAVIADDTRE